jgi:nucleotide-binding universal stress UspA family protein
MREIHRILVPVDFSDCSRAAVECASLLAERFGASIHVLHVWETPHYVGPEFLIREPGETGNPLEKAALTQAESEMYEFLWTPAPGSGKRGREGCANGAMPRDDDPAARASA